MSLRVESGLKLSFTKVLCAAKFKAFLITKAKQIVFLAYKRLPDTNLLIFGYCEIVLTIAARIKSNKLISIPSALFFFIKES